MDNQAGVVASGILDRFERFSSMDDRYIALLGWPRAALIGRSMLDLTHPDDRTGNRTLLDRLYARNEAFRITKRYRRPDDSYIRVAVHVSLVPDGLGGRQLLGTAQRLDIPPPYEQSRMVAGRAITALLAGRMALGTDYFSGAPAEILLMLFHLDRQPATGADIAARLGIAPGVTLRWLRALACAGLIHPLRSDPAAPIRLTLRAEATLATILAAPTVVPQPA